MDPRTWTIRTIKMISGQNSGSTSLQSIFISRLWACQDKTFEWRSIDFFFRLNSAKYDAWCRCETLHIVFWWLQGDELLTSTDHRETWLTFRFYWCWSLTVYLFLDSHSSLQWDWRVTDASLRLRLSENVNMPYKAKKAANAAAPCKALHWPGESKISKMKNIVSPHYKF